MKKFMAHGKKSAGVCKLKFKPECKLKFKQIFDIAMLATGAALLLMFAIFAAAPSLVAPYNPKLSFEPFLSCSPQHILGTNNLGYDVFSELVYATRATLIVGLGAAVISLVIGVAMGLLSGYLSGVAGEALNGLINFFLLIPLLPVALIVAAYLGSGQLNIIIIISLLGWCGTARAVRAKTIKLKNMPFVEIMRGLNYSRSRILFFHILPNIADVALARYLSSVAGCILLEATLSFLGLGDASHVTWGLMINYAYKFGGLARGAYNWLLAPGICIMLLELAFYFINYFIESRLETVKSGGNALE